MSEVKDKDIFAPGMFEFFGCFWINKEQQWDKGDQRTYNFCCERLLAINDFGDDYVNDN